MCIQSPGEEAVAHIYHSVNLSWSVQKDIAEWISEIILIPQINTIEMVILGSIFVTQNTKLGIISTL